MVKKYKNNLERSKGALMNRWSDQKYYLNRYLYYKNHDTNPTFTREDLKKKCEILEIPNCKTCFITGKECNGKGDHLFEINGYAKVTNGLHGVYDDWNTVPVIGSMNKTYKTKYNDKNIGYQELTDNDLLQCTDEQKTIYNKIQRWKEYVISRGASLTWKFNDQDTLIFNEKKNEYMKLWSDLE